jgi:putative endonuclease
MPYFAYILFSDKTKRYYIGSTQDIQKRLERHNAGATKSTKTGRPWRLVYSEKFESRSDAIKREYNLKKMKSKSYIEILIRNNSTI